MRKYVLTLVAAGLIGSGGAAKATTIDNLKHLVDTDGTLTIDDKIFSDFGYSADGLSFFNPANIIVTASQIGSTEYLTFVGNISVQGPAGTTGDLLLTYTVEAINGHTIDSIDQFYAGGSSPSGSGDISIAELVVDAASGNVVAYSRLDISDLADPPSPGFEGDQLVITDPISGNPTPLPKLDVLKDIALGINGNAPLSGGGLVSVSVVRQSFHQPNGHKVPDGGTTVMMLGFALSGLGLLRRKLA